jgi:hypothetical protein
LSSETGAEPTCRYQGDSGHFTGTLSGEPWGRIKLDFAHLYVELKRPNVSPTLLRQEYCATNAGGPLGEDFV